MHTHQGRGISQIAQDQTATHGGGADHRVLGFRNQGLPLRCGRRLAHHVAQVHADQPGVGGVLVGAQHQVRAGQHQRRVAGIESHGQRPRLAAGKAAAGQGQQLQAIAPPAAVAADADEQHAAIVADAGAEAPGLVVAVLEHQRVGRLRGAQAVVVQLLELVDARKHQATLGLVVAGVEKALAVGRPHGAAELHPIHHIGQVLAAGHVAHTPDLPVRTGLGHAIDQQLAVAAGHSGGQGHGAGGGQGVRVQQHPGLCAQGGGRVQHGLLLQTVVAGPEVAPAFLEGHAEALVIDQGAENAPRRVTLGHGGQRPVGDGVLRLHPSLGLGAVVVFQPAVGVGHLAAEIGVDVLDFAAGRVDTRGIGGIGCQRRDAASQQDGGQKTGGQQAAASMRPCMVDRHAGFQSRGKMRHCDERRFDALRAPASRLSIC